MPDYYYPDNAPWYSQRDKIKKVVIENGVTSIGHLAFKGCSNLTSVTLPNSVTSIGGSAFWECSGLTSITIPNSVTSIGSGAFSGCTGLTSIIVEKGNKYYDSRNNCNAIIRTESNTIIRGCKNTIIPNTVTRIEGEAFQYCSELISITIPNSVTSIGSYAFSSCSNLTSITIPNSVTSIGSYAFAASGLTSITIPNSVTSIGYHAFNSCSGLTSITVEKDNKYYDSRNNCNAIIQTESNTIIRGCKNTIIPNTVTSIGESAFGSCSGLTSITIPNSVTSIGSYAFAASGLTSITIPNSVTSIGNKAFDGCSKVTSVTIGMNNIKIIQNNIFNCCTNISSVTIIDGETSIEDYAFRNYESLTSITIPKSVTNIGKQSFYHCTGLTSITIPNSVTNIGNQAFYGCTALSSISLPNSLTSIEEDAFSGCTALTSLSIPNSVTRIGSAAFYGCSGLTSITIPNSSTSFEKNVFGECTALTSVHINNIASWCKIKFEDVTSNPLNFAHHLYLNEKEITNLVIPEGIKQIEPFIFAGLTSIISLTLPNSIESINDKSFFNCCSLQSITINKVTPPSMVKDIYKCSTNYVRDAYDVYNYTTLHIPMGSKDVYSSAQEWRYFKNIKEDMDIDGKVYYAKLAVKQGTTGYTEQPVKADETYTIYIGALGENKINAVTFNGEDVTDQVKDGYYTTPAIKAKSTLSISYEESNTTNVKEISNPDLKVTGNEDEINISGIDNPTNIEVYTTDGKLVETRGSVSGDTRIQVKEDELYLVKVGKRTIKIAM